MIECAAVEHGCFAYGRCDGECRVVSIIAAAIQADRTARAAKYTPDAERFDTIIAAKEEDARLEEREAHIAICNDFPESEVAKRIAAGIRSRGARGNRSPT